MLDEVLETLAPRDQETYIDATFGAGGYSHAILNQAKCFVVAMDRDPEAGERASNYQRSISRSFFILPRALWSNGAIDATDRI